MTKKTKETRIKSKNTFSLKKKKVKHLLNIHCDQPEKEKEKVLTSLQNQK